MYASTDVAKNVYVNVVDQKLGGGELSLSACPGVGNIDLQERKILQIPGCMPGGGGMVTSKIVACDTGQQHTMARSERAP